MSGTWDPGHSTEVGGFGAEVPPIPMLGLLARSQGVLSCSFWPNSPSWSKPTGHFSELLFLLWGSLAASLAEKTLKPDVPSWYLRTFPGRKLSLDRWTKEQNKMLPLSGHLVLISQTGLPPASQAVQHGPRTHLSSKGS